MSLTSSGDVPQGELGRLQFVKAHACGNDFLILREEDAKRQHAMLARRLCARNTGIGADGIEFLERRPDGGLFLRLFNADGTEAELSGNGTRCVAAWLALTEGRMDVGFGTHGGLRQCQVVERTGSLFQVRSAMGVPRVLARTLPIPDVGDVAGVMVNVGNPHFVVFVEDESFAAHGLAWQEAGARLSHDRYFPHGTNVEFVRMISRDEIAFRVFERGCGPTLSSGTGTCAAAAAAITQRGAARTLRVVSEGGAQEVSWSGEREEMLLTGPAEVVCEGALLLDGFADQPQSAFGAEEKL